MVKINYAFGFLTGILFLCGRLSAQSPVLPHGFAPWEFDELLEFNGNRILDAFVTPPVSPVRASAEWEEIDALTVTWTSYIPTVREIVRYASEECKVYIICSDSVEVQTDLTDHDIPLENIYCIEADFNSVWCRDYGQWNIYTNNVDSLYLGDWIYNRPRPEDDVVPGVISDFTGIPIYQTIQEPFDLVSTGGNFMCDGWGTGFSSKLILDAYQGGGLTIEPQNEDTVDMIMNEFMGISRYIKMETLPYDEIHHIDMHLKLLDEETLLVGEYPADIADGPQIEENLNYILDNYNSVFGTPYKVVRMPMPPDAMGKYPDNGGAYRTYTNCVFVNKTVLVPYYEQEFDTTAYRILHENLPGYKIIGINCNSIINALGAIHCITKEVATNNPLLITHQPLHDTENTVDDYQVDAWILHRSGIAGSKIMYRTDTLAPWQETEMVLIDEITNTWTGFIPSQPYGTTVYYYIQATANDGKMQVRPITAPAGFWKFKIGEPVEVQSFKNNLFQLYPNPFAEFVTIQLAQKTEKGVDITVTDLAGKIVYANHTGPMEGKTTLIFGDLPSGTYILQLKDDATSASCKIIKL